MFKADDCILVMGQRGCGKSYLAQNIAKVWPRKVVLDTLNDYNDGDIVFSFEEFCAALLRYRTTQTSTFNLIYKFDPESEISDTEFNEILRICYYFGNIQIIIEEIHNFSSPHQLPHWLRQCLLTGRHQNLSLLFSTQRPGELHKTILSQCSHIFVGKIFEGNDLKYISSFLRTNSEKLVLIPPRQFLHFSETGIQQITNDFEKIDDKLDNRSTQPNTGELNNERTNQKSRNGRSNQSARDLHRE